MTHSTIKIKLPEVEKSKSRKVNKYVRLWTEASTLERVAFTLRQELGALSMTLTGGQLGEAKRILGLS